jgi:hypothetical protein
MRHHPKVAHLSRYAGWKYYLKLNQQYAFITIQKISYTVKLYSIMFQWQPPPSSDKSTSVNQNIAVISCLSVLSCTQRFTLHPHQHRAHLSKLCVDGGAKLTCVCIRQTAYNSGVLVQSGGLPLRWLCPTLKHAGIHFDCIRDFLNCYTCLLLVKFFR